MTAAPTIVVPIGCIHCGGQLHDVPSPNLGRGDERTRRILLECDACRHTVVLTASLHDYSRVAGRTT